MLQEPHQRHENVQKEGIVNQGERDKKVCTYFIVLIKVVYKRDSLKRFELGLIFLLSGKENIELSLLIVEEF